MLCGRLEGWRAIAGLEGLEAGFGFLERTDLAALPLGRRAILGDTVYAIAMKAPSRTPESAQLESHRDYIDIQFLLSGEEMIGVLPVGQLAVAAPYDPAKDITWHPIPPRYFALTIPPGHFAVFFPDEGHLPLCHAGGFHELHKVVVKVKVSRWEAQRKR